jgi:predicted mannosyl-3-phosphoglycerate phosphatase (HAD superfamily)
MAKTPLPAIVFLDADAVPLAPPCHRLAGALERLAARRVTIVLCSHRTRAELEGVRQSLGIFHPFVCEGGAVAFVPERYFGSDLENARKIGGYQAIEFGSPYEHVTGTLRRAADRLELGVVGFHDMSVEQVARECGLSLLEAQLAKLREYAEPFRLVSPNPVAERRLMKALDGAGISCVPFGGFHHAGTIAGPGAAASVLVTLYRVAFGAVVTAAVGDHLTQPDMARRVDVTFRIDASQPFEWLDAIVRNIERTRDDLPSRTAARLAR